MRDRPISIACAAVCTMVLASTPVGVAAQESPAVVPRGASREQDPFARRGWHLELSAGAAVESWNYNLNHEEIFGPYAGLTYGLGRSVTLIAGWPMYYVSQRGADAWMIGATWGVRSRFARIRRSSLFWEFEVGLAKAETSVPPRGTRFNFLAQGGAGASVRVRSGMHAMAALEWIHVSNAGLPAGRDRNPDIEAVGIRVGFLLGF